MSSAKLDALTPELFDIVLQDLGLDDIRQLRLVNRETCVRATQDRFISSLRSKNVDLTQSGLESFAHMTSRRQRLGCLVRHLTLTGVLYDLSMLETILETGIRTVESRRPRTKEKCSEAEMTAARKCYDELRQRYEGDKAFHKTGEDLALLSQSMRSIASEPQCELEALSLEVVVYDEDTVMRKSSIPFNATSRIKVFRTAAETFRLVARSLRETGPRIGRFELFGRTPGTTRFNLPHDAFSQLDWADSEQNWTPFRSLKAISLCLSDRFMGADLMIYDPTPVSHTARQENSHDRELGTDTHHLASHMKMLSLCRDLEELRITWHKITPGNSSSSYKVNRPERRARRRYIDELALLIPFTRLRIFHLAGFVVNVTELCRFVQNHQSTIREICLRSISIVYGSFASFLSLLVSPASSIEHIHLEDLREFQGAVRFLREQRSQYTQVHGDQHDNIIQRRGEDVKLRIECTTERRSMTVGSGDVWRAADRRRVEFGPMSETADMSYSERTGAFR